MGSEHFKGLATQNAKFFGVMMEEMYILNSVCSYYKIRWASYSQAALDAL